MWKMTRFIPVCLGKLVRQGCGLKRPSRFVPEGLRKTAGSLTENVNPNIYVLALRPSILFSLTVSPQMAKKVSQPQTFLSSLGARARAFRMEPTSLREKYLQEVEVHASDRAHERGALRVPIC